MGDKKGNSAAVIRVGDFAWRYCVVKGRSGDWEVIVVPDGCVLTGEGTWLIKITRGGRLSPQAVTDRGVVAFSHKKIPKDTIGYRVIGQGKDGRNVFVEPVRGSLRGLQQVYWADAEFGAMEHTAGRIDSFPAILALALSGEMDDQKWFDAVNEFVFKVKNPEKKTVAQALPIAALRAPVTPEEPPTAA